jgi:hypothetical protein
LFRRGEYPVGLGTPVGAAGKSRCRAIAEGAGIGKLRHPGVALGAAGGRPGRESGLAHGLRHLAHLLGAAAAVLDDALEEVAALLLPVDAGKGFSSEAITASSTPWARAAVKLSITIASRPLIITLRHILVAETTPSFRRRHGARSRAP